jgi:uncharacterized protein
MEKSKIDQWEERFIVYYNSQGGLTDGSHDLGHFQRVWRIARDINRQEGEEADELVLLASAYFHDLISLPKNHSERGTASRLSADRAVQLLKERWDGWPAAKLEGVWHAIHAHSYSAGVEAVTAEAKILQDADRMEAVGAIGLARVFYTAGQLNARLFDAEDPLADGREPDDKQYALDHFQLKLLRLPAMMNTAAGRRMAEGRAEYLREFLSRICLEIRGS